MGIGSKLWIISGRIDALTTLRLSIYAHDVSRHLFRYSLVFLSNTFSVGFFIKCIPMYLMYFWYFYTCIFINKLWYFSKWWGLIFFSFSGKDISDPLLANFSDATRGYQLWPPRLTSGPQTSLTLQLSVLLPSTPPPRLWQPVFYSLFLWVWLIFLRCHIWVI